MDISKVEGSLSDADYGQKKRATREFLILYCAAIAESKPEASELEAMLGPPKERKHTLNQAAVAATEEEVHDAKVWLVAMAGEDGGDGGDDGGEDIVGGDGGDSIADDDAESIDD